MENSLSIAEAKSHFSELVSRAAAGERIVIKRRSRPLVVLMGAAEVEQLERIAALGQRLALALGQAPNLLEQIERGEVHPAMAAFGLWHDVAESATLTNEIATNRQNQPTRPVLEL